MLSKLIEPVLDEVQKKINDAYAKDGLSDELLTLQVKVNSIRNTLDSPDASEQVYEEYVQ